MRAYEIFPEFFWTDELVLNELFNPQGKVRFIRKGNSYESEFTTKSGQHYVVQYKFTGEIKNRMDLGAKTQDFLDKIRGDKFSSEYLPAWFLSFGLVQDGDIITSVTGTGSSIEVFTQVANSLNSFIRQFKPNSICFIGMKTDKHASLYSRMMKSVAKLISSFGYVIKTTDYPEALEFEIIKKSLKSP